MLHFPREPFIFIPLRLNPAAGEEPPGETAACVGGDLLPAGGLGISGPQPCAPVPGCADVCLFLICGAWCALCKACFTSAIWHGQATPSL